EQEVESQLLLCEAADVWDPSSICERQCNLAAIFHRFGEPISELRAKFVGEVQGTHFKAFRFGISDLRSPSLRANNAGPGFFNVASTGSRCTLLGSFISAPSNARGRGGQPAT